MGFYLRIKWDVEPHRAVGQTLCQENGNGAVGSMNKRVLIGKRSFGVWGGKLCIRNPWVFTEGIDMGTGGSGQ